MVGSGSAFRLCAAAGLAVLIASACAEPPKPVVAPTPAPAPPPPPPIVAPPATPKFFATPGLSPRDRIRKVLSLLSDGQPDQARAEVQAFLKEQPDNELGRSLLDQIDKDPKVLLGEQSFPYKIRSGETLSILAERYLGDRFLFYALARYNNLTGPLRTEVGQSILIPGAPKKIISRKPARAESDEEVVEQRLKEREARKPAPPPVSPAEPARPAADPARANALRAQALEQENRGAIDLAVTLLRQAATLDPGNALIRRELDRAVRIQGATHAGADLPEPPSGDLPGAAGCGIAATVFTALGELAPTPRRRVVADERPRPGRAGPPLSWATSRSNAEVSISRSADRAGVSPGSRLSASS